MSIELGDSWSASSAGASHVTYYPEGGSPVSDTTSYTYGNFWRMNELYVEDGHLKYEISDDEILYAICINCKSSVKSMHIEG